LELPFSMMTGLDGLSSTLMAGATRLKGAKVMLRKPESVAMELVLGPLMKATRL
jgi:hypothetical protein